MVSFKNQPYIPTEEDIEFTNQLIRVIKDGGQWGWPKTGLVFTLDKTNKILKCQNYTPQFEVEMNMAKEVFKAVGWSVEI